MNAKSERIEQLIQIVNRNLLLIYNGQVEGVTPVESGSFLTTDKAHGTNKSNSVITPKIDLSVFDGDKFGYEMVNFFRTHIKSNKNSLAAIWERNFVKGVETLMMECAVIKDSIERECFVSRVYVWFTDKLVERRNLPGQDDIQYDEIELLRNTMSALGAFHSVKALDNLTELKKISDSEVQQQQVQEPEVIVNETMTELGLEGQGMDQLKLPPITPRKNRKEPVRTEDRPTIDEEGYQPETEAEKVMHELWIARRRQEAFEWKAKQNLNLIMDRRDLHQSRLESEALRRQETSSYLAGPQNSEETMGPEDDVLLNESSRFVPKMRRPLSGKRHFANIISDIELDDDIQSTRHSIEKSGGLETTSLQEINKNIQVTTVNIVREGAHEQAKVSNVARQVVQKNTKKPYVPMRFRSKAPDSFTAGTTSRTKKESFDVVSGAARKGSAPSSNAAVHPKPDVQPLLGVKSEKNPSQKSTEINKRNSLSQKNLHTLGANDSELQVHYQYSLSRKGPLSEKHKEWLQSREEERHERDLAYNKKLRHDPNRGGDDTNGIPMRKTIAKKKSGATPLPTPRGDGDSVCSTPRVYVQPKYQSAQAFMDTHFPVFDMPHQEDAHGLLRQQQLLECEEVLESFEMHGQGPSNIIITREALEKGLMIPQDRPKTICMEGLKDNVEGLMVNPLPKELWRTVVMVGTGGGGGGKKKGSKKKTNS